MSNAQRPDINWPPLEPRIRTLHAQGLPDRDIAATLGVEYFAFVAKRKRMGLKPNSPRPGGGWSDEQEQTLRKLAGLRRSAADTAAILGKTRCAVISRAKKLGVKFQGGSGGGRRPHSTAPWQPRAPFTLKEIEDRRHASREIGMAMINNVAVIPLSAKPWMEREPGECAFPVGGRGEATLSCCARTIPGKPYCSHHFARMYRPPEGLLSDSAMAQAAKADFYPGRRRAA